MNDAAATVLIVENSPVYREAFTSLLELCFPNVHVIHAEDAAGALSITRLLDVDLIFLDYYLESLTGGDVARYLRQRAQASGRSLPTIVCMSTAPDVRVFARSMGAAAFLSKPVSPDELLAVVEPLLQRSLAMRACGADRR